MADQAVDPKVLEMRRLMAERYKKARPEDRPQKRDCPECGASVYSSSICMASGRLHDRENKTLLGGSIVEKDKRVFTGKELVAAVDAVRIRWQGARSSKITIDGDSASIFQTFVLQRQWKHMRCGILYGTYDESTKALAVHCVYEPDQIGSDTTFDLVPDAREARVDLLAGYLGFRRLGLIITHPPRDVEECVLEGKELLLLAREQSRFGDHCVLFAVAPNVESRNVQAQAWQASEQCVNLYRIGLLSECADDTRYVASNQPLEIAQDETDSKGRKNCVIKEPSSKVDARWMIAPVAVESFASDIIGNKFIRISRPGEAPPNFGNLRRFLDDPKRKTLSIVEQLRDFHVLVFLMENLFDVHTEMPKLVSSILKKNKTEIANFEIILRDHMRHASGSS